jgi:hypothetical protein
MNPKQRGSKFYELRIRRTEKRFTRIDDLRIRFFLPFSPSPLLALSLFPPFPVFLARSFPYNHFQKNGRTPNQEALLNKRAAEACRVGRPHTVEGHLKTERAKDRASSGHWVKWQVQGAQKRRKRRRPNDAEQKEQKEPRTQVESALYSPTRKTQ